MAKPLTRPCSMHSLNALALMGQLVHEARLKKNWSMAALAERAGISRALLQRIEQGDPGCSIGAVFEAAVLCDVPLFGLDGEQVKERMHLQQEKLALMPKSVRLKLKEVKDDF